jgi:hypothetical protein
MAEEEKPDVTNKHVGDKAEVARVLAWRKQHPDRYRETQRNLMRKRRANPDQAEAVEVEAGGDVQAVGSGSGDEGK